LTRRRPQRHSLIARFNFPVVRQVFIAQKSNNLHKFKSIMGAWRLESCLEPVISLFYSLLLGNQAESGSPTTLSSARQPPLLILCLQNREIAPVCALISAARATRSASPGRAPVPRVWRLKHRAANHLHQISAHEIRLRRLHSRGFHFFMRWHRRLCAGVAPCPMEHETAGPTRCARDAAKFNTAFRYDNFA
jgi:hypothetical protein